MGMAVILVIWPRSFEQTFVPQSRHRSYVANLVLVTVKTLPFIWIEINKKLSDSNDLLIHNNLVHKNRCIQTVQSQNKLDTNLPHNAYVNCA